MEYQGPLSPCGEPLSEEAARMLAREALERAQDPWQDPWRDLRQEQVPADPGHHLQVPKLDFRQYGHPEPSGHHARGAPAPYTRIPSAHAPLSPGYSRLPQGIQTIASRTARAWLRTEHYFIIGLMVLVLAGAGLELLGQSG